MAKVSKEEKELLIGAGVLAILYFGVLKPVTNAFGLTDSVADKQKKQVIETASGNNGWNPNFYRNYTATHATGWTLLTDTFRTKIAMQIYKAWGFNDDEDAIYAAFSYLQSQLHLSQVVEKYSQLYKQDLLKRLKLPWNNLTGRDGLTTAEFANVATIVNKLPITWKQ